MMSNLFKHLTPYHVFLFNEFLASIDGATINLNTVAKCVNTLLESVYTSTPNIHPLQYYLFLNSYRNMPFNKMGILMNPLMKRFLNSARSI